MHIVVPVKLVPDLVEELVMDESGAALDASAVRLVLSEFDDHAIEQAILLKERSGGQVTVVAPAVEGADEVLYTAAAKGADRLVRLTNDFERGMNNHGLARALAEVLKTLQPDLVLTGVQAHDDLDGSLGPLLAEYCGMPYVGYVAGLALAEGKAVARKEYPGGLAAEMEITLPAVLGIQAAERPPRYVAVSKVRQAMRTATIAETRVASLEPGGGPAITRLFLPEAGRQAVMIEGSVEEIAARLVAIFKELGLL